MKNCFICNIEYEKGIGICCSRQCHNRRINSRDRSNDKHVIEKQYHVENYNKYPKKCSKIGCNNYLTYIQRTSLYCSRSCSASATNKSRPHEIYEKQSTTIKDTLFEKGYKVKITNPHSNVWFNNCKNCNHLFSTKNSKIKYCGDSCRINSGINVYRRSCKFKISKIKYPKLFNKELLEKHGWYRASNHIKGYNPDGATWDHLFRVEDGFKLKISPEIMSHPANAEMISWKENTLRRRSIITYEELLERIKVMVENNGIEPLTF